MNANPKRKALAYLTVAFMAGGLAGGVAGGLTGFKLGLARPPRPLPPQQMAADIRLRLEQDLRLTEEQGAEVTPVVDTFVREMETVHAEAVSESVLAIQRMHRRIEPILTAEQQGRFREIQEEREAAFRRATRPPPP